MLNYRRKKHEIETKQDKKRELELEDAIIAEKASNGRVRNSFMDSKREEYGRDVADRILHRINKRISKGYFKQNGHVDKKPINQNNSKIWDGNNHSVY